MLATDTCARAVFAVLVLHLIAGNPSVAQSTTFLGTSKTSDAGMRPGTGPSNCATPSTAPAATLRLGRGRETQPRLNRVGEDFLVPAFRDSACLQPAPDGPARTDNPCPQNADGAAVAPGGFRCGGTADQVLAQLSELGKPGRKIEEARREVLKILQAENACTEWFEAKDGTPAATFQSIEYSIDKHGPQNILELELTESTSILRQPYVASATQDGGAHTKITINANGAFYRPQGNVQKLRREMGPAEWDGTHELQVGTYRGDTLRAQMVTLLHEFGHIVDLLPEDADNLDGKSVRNTDEVLRHCGAEVEAHSQQAKRSAKN